jgi:hypothetical protein
MIRFHDGMGPTYIPKRSLDVVYYPTVLKIILPARPKIPFLDIPLILPVYKRCTFFRCSLCSTFTGYSDLSKPRVCVYSEKSVYIPQVWKVVTFVHNIRC